MDTAFTDKTYCYGFRNYKFRVISSYAPDSNKYYTVAEAAGKRYFTSVDMIPFNNVKFTVTEF